MAGGGLAGEKSRSPACGGDARAFGCNGVGRGIGEVSHDLPADGGVRIEEPFKVRGTGYVIEWTHFSVIARGVRILLRALAALPCAGQFVWSFLTQDCRLIELMMRPDVPRDQANVSHSESAKQGGQKSVSEDKIFSLWPVVVGEI